jgi:menaquinone-dependent protoporphyrinogen oxidase
MTGVTRRILIAYASRTGSTAEIARAVAKELEAMGFGVVVGEIDTVSSISGFDAVVIGTPVYMGNPGKSVGKFVTRFREGLGNVPVAAFAVGMAPVDSKVGSVDIVRENLQKSLHPLRAVATTVFAGRLDPDRMSFMDRIMTRLMGVQTGDFRDWDAIALWARNLPAVLKV